MSILIAPQLSPRVSVVMAAYNAEQFIAATLDSVAHQSFDDFEILVIDDGSIDSTAEVVRHFAATDWRCRIITQENLGPSAARNNGVAGTSGEFIAFLDHDDLWQPDKIALQVALLDSRPEIDVAICYSAVLDEDGCSLGWRLGGLADGNVYKEMIEWDMVSGGSVVMVRREKLNSVGVFDENLRYREDWDMWIRLSRCASFATVPRVLVGYTRRGQNSSREYERMSREGMIVLERLITQDPSISAATLRFCGARDLFAMACFCAMDENSALAWRYLAQSVSRTPAPLLRSPRRWAFLAVLTLQSALPRWAFRRVFALLSRASFRLERGRPFLESSAGKP